MILKQVTGNVRMLVVNPTEEVDRRAGGTGATAAEPETAVAVAEADATLKPDAAAGTAGGKKGGEIQINLFSNLNSLK